MQENTFMISKVHFVKIIHIELTHKRREAIVTEILGQYDILHSFLVEDSDAS